MFIRWFRGDHFNEQGQDCTDHTVPVWHFAVCRPAADPGATRNDPYFPSNFIIYEPPGAAFFISPYVKKKGHHSTYRMVNCYVMVIIMSLPLIRCFGVREPQLWPSNDPVERNLRSKWFHANLFTRTPAFFSQCAVLLLCTGTMFTHLPLLPNGTVRYCSVLYVHQNTTGTTASSQ